MYVALGLLDASSGCHPLMSPPIAFDAVIFRFEMSIKATAPICTRKSRQHD